MNLQSSHLHIHTQQKRLERQIIEAKLPIFLKDNAIKAIPFGKCGIPITVSRILLEE